MKPVKVPDRGLAMKKAGKYKRSSCMIFRISALAVILTVMILAARDASSGVAGNVRASKHNLSATGAGYPQQNIRAQTEDQVCIFCHTPHTPLSVTPLWNHNLSSVASYTWFTSGTMLSKAPSGNKPDGDSLLCLSCHDGDQPVGAVQNIGGQSMSIPMRGTNIDASYKMVGPNSFGTNLSGHHPISIEISACLVGNKQTECTNPPGPISMKLVSGIASDFLKKTSNQYTPPGGLYTCGTVDHPGTGVQCSSCHDAHSSAWMFLRTGDQPAPWGGRDYTDNLCLACHTGC